MSGGNKRKLCTAMALMGCPKIVLMDEPTTGVDPVSRRRMVSLFKAMQNSSIMLSTHRMDEAELLCNRIGIMRDGQMVCYGTPQQVNEQYSRGYQVSITVQKELKD